MVLIIAITAETFSMNKKFLIVVVGPTAIGKTSLAIELAAHFKTEIISADSRQFFKEMSIGTAVPSNEELEKIPHHFIQHLSIEDDYSVGDFEREALALIDELFKKHDVLVMVGGSGLYIDAVVNGLDHFPEVDPEIRKHLNHQLEKQGIERLQKELKELDPQYFSEVDLHNPHRIIRALEICIGTGKPYSYYRKKKITERYFTPVFIGLTAEREVVYDRINKRVDLMLEHGLIEEAKQLFSKKEFNALNTVGYKELFKYFEKEWDLQKAVEEIKKNTRRFAKRQLTWFRKNPDINWFDYQAEAAVVVNTVEQIIQEK